MSVLSDLRRWMIQENLDYFLVSSTDEYLNEYIPIEQNARYYITGFTGSTGDVLVGLDDATLFVDGRYHKQADDEVYPSLINVFKYKLGESQRESIVGILKNKGKIRVGLVSSKISYYSFYELQKKLPEVVFVEYENDIVLDLANISTLKTDMKVSSISTKIVGENSDSKLTKVQKQFKHDAFVVTKLDEIAYLTNCRSFEISYSSCYKAKAILTKQGCTIFTNQKIGKIGKKFQIKPEDEFFNCLNSFENKKILISTTASNLKTYRAIEGNEIEEVKTSPIAKIKAIKNDSEIYHMKKCFKKTDKVIRKMQKWALSKKEKSEEQLSGKVLHYFKRQWAKGLSFKTIAASGENTAIVHYSRPSEKLLQDQIVLVDCGGYFKGGYATDITQTFFCGETPSKVHKQVYTAVLKGFLAGVHYPLKKTTKGQSLDRAVRKIVDKNAPEGFAFSHSTGHGVGILVHEGPPFITSSEWGKDILKPGMCFSIEPGLYKDNDFGVRIERVVYVDENHQIVPLSRAPFDDKLIDNKMLTKQEQKWVKDWQEGKS